MINFPITFGGTVKKHVILLKPNNLSHSHEQNAEYRKRLKTIPQGLLFKFPLFSNVSKLDLRFHHMCLSLVRGRAGTLPYSVKSMSYIMDG